MQSIVEGLSVVVVVVVVVAYCQTAGCGSWDEEVDNFNETVRRCDLLVPALGLPEVHVLPEKCGPVPSLLRHQTPAASSPSTCVTLHMCLHYETLL